MKKQFSICVDKAVIICEHHGEIKNAKKILLFCHGFPGLSRLVRLYDNLKNNSISIVEMHYRGDKKSEGKFSFLGSIKDIKTASNFLKEKYKLPIYALGYSMGGFYVSNIIINDPNVFEKVILLNPVVDSMALFSNKPLIDELWIHAKNILSLNKPETYKEEITRVISDLNPIGFVKQIKNNIVIIQSTGDEVLEPKLAKKFYNLLNSKKSYVEIPNKKHDLMGDEKELLDALRFYLN